MDEIYQISNPGKPDDDAWNAVGGGIHQFNVQQAGESGFEHLCFLLRGQDQQIVGGVIGETHWGWFYLNLLWVKEELRGCGWGSRLLASAEAEARQRGVKHVYLDTFSFQAPDFYKKHGYRAFGELPDFPAGHTRYFLVKHL